MAGSFIVLQEQTKLTELAMCNGIFRASSLYWVHYNGQSPEQMLNINQQLEA